VDELSPLEAQQRSAIPGYRRPIGPVLALFLVLTCSQAMATEPLSESFRAGGDAAVAELSDIREQNQKADSRYEKYADGLYVLKLFGTVSADKSYQINAWNLLIGPGKATTEFELPGSAVLLFKAGAAQVTVDGKQERDLKMGDTLVVPEKSSIRITNLASDRPVTVRATLFSGNE
jgi:mannose-6-phosphate isomerase-like protein (cupin superfamily)